MCNKTEDELFEHYYNLVVKLRGVRKPCSKCKGLGVFVYPTTCTWWYDGGQAIHHPTRDICDECWGTGDRVFKGTNIKELQKQVLDCK